MKSHKTLGLSLGLILALTSCQSTLLPAAPTASQEQVLQATIGALQTRVGKAEPTEPSGPLPTTAPIAGQPPPPDSAQQESSSATTEAEILYTTPQGNRTAFGLLNPSSHESRTILASAVVTGNLMLGLYYGEGNYFPQQAAIRTRIGEYLFFSPAAPGTMKLLSVDVQGQITELIPSVPHYEHLGYEAWYDDSGRHLIVAGTVEPISGKQQGVVYLVNTDGSGFKMWLDYQYVRLCSDGNNLILLHTSREPAVPSLEIHHLEDSSYEQLPSGEIGQVLRADPDCNNIWGFLNETDASVLYRLSRSGHKVPIVVSSRLEEVQMSPDFRHILYEETLADGGRHLYLANSDGSRILQLASAISSLIPDFEEGFSSDGLKLWFATYDEQANRQSLNIADGDGSNIQTVLTVDYETEDDASKNRLKKGIFEPELSPGNTWLAVGYDSPRQEERRVYFFGRGGRQLVYPLGYCSRWFSPAGRYSVFCDPSGEFYLLDLETGQKTQFYSRRPDEFLLAHDVIFSPDEKWFAFRVPVQRNQESTCALYVGDTTTGQMNKMLDNACLCAWVFPQ